MENSISVLYQFPLLTHGVVERIDVARRSSPRILYYDKGDYSAVPLLAKNKNSLLYPSLSPRRDHSKLPGDKNRILFFSLESIVTLTNEFIYK